MTNKERVVQYELMFGREATAEIRSYPVGYLPIGCLERHGDHLPMGLDSMKAHKVCCLAAKEIGGIVFPAHHYSGIHKLSEQQIAKYTGEWGNIYNDASAIDSLTDVINQIAICGINVLVLYSGHYPDCQTEMILGISKTFESHESIKVIPFCERMIMEGDHAGISETSFMLYLDKDLVRMSRISDINYQDHGWSDRDTPDKASPENGDASVKLVIDHLRQAIKKALDVA